MFHLKVISVNSATPSATTGGNQEYVVMPDSNVVLSILFPQETTIGVRNKEILEECSARILSRVVLLESFFKIVEKVQKVWSIIQKWYFGDERYLFKYTDSARDKQRKLDHMHEDLQAAKVLSDEQIGNILFLLERNRPPAEIDEHIQHYLDQVFFGLRTEFSDFIIYPRAHLFPSELMNRSIEELVQYWIETRYRSFYMADDRIREELKQATQMRQVGSTISSVADHCPPISSIDPTDKMILTEYLMIHDWVRAPNGFFMLTADELLRLLSAWTRKIISSSIAVFNVRTISSKRCDRSCVKKTTCQIDEY